MHGPTHGHLDLRKISPFYRTLSPTGAAAQKNPNDMYVEGFHEPSRLIALHEINAFWARISKAKIGKRDYNLFHNVSLASLRD